MENIYETDENNWGFHLEKLLPNSILTLNAIAHKDYCSGIPIQISVYPDKMIFWHEGQLPENWTVEKLTQKHPSKPYNPDIANMVIRFKVPLWHLVMETINCR